VGEGGNGEHADKWVLNGRAVWDAVTFDGTDDVLLDRLVLHHCSLWTIIK
jgi:hypothetical protein